jgi:hypothetical protein
MSQNRSINQDNLTLQHLAKTFEDAAYNLFTPDCPLYVELSKSVACESDLLALASCSRLGQVPAVLLFYIVHYLLLRGEKDPLAEFYSSLTSHPAPPSGAPPVFADFCRKHIQEIQLLLQTKLVQTNEVRRCILLLPAIVLASETVDSTPLALIDMGASAGLNLLFDRYGYNYDNRLRCGDLNSPVQLFCTLRGLLCPPIPKIMPKIASRIGIDLNPLDINEYDDCLWLLAQIWPNESFNLRAERMRVAVELARHSPPRLITGDLVEILPDIISKIPAGQTICLLHSFSFYELSNHDRGRIGSIIKQFAAKRPIISVTLELSPDLLTIATVLEFSSYHTNGEIETRKLARCHNYGEWMEWLYS